MIPHDLQRLISLSRRAGIVTLAQFEVLAFIAEHDGPLDDSKIAARCGISRTGSLHITRRLHKLEFIERHVTQTRYADGRITLSPLGRAWFESVGISTPVTIQP
jgi:DNA-binding MarR family transcriptional regulator